jgi:hypothetical protein
MLSNWSLLVGWCALPAPVVDPPSSPPEYAESARNQDSCRFSTIPPWSVRCVSKTTIYEICTVSDSVRMNCVVRLIPFTFKVKYCAGRYNVRMGLSTHFRTDSGAGIGTICNDTESDRLRESWNTSYNVGLLNSPGYEEMFAKAESYRRFLASSYRLIGIRTFKSHHRKLESMILEDAIDSRRGIQRTQLSSYHGGGGSQNLKCIQV